MGSDSLVNDGWCSCHSLAEELQAADAQRRERLTAKLEELCRDGCGLTQHQAREIVGALWPE